MSDSQPEPTMQPSSKIQRRAFLKMVGAGLLASIPIAAGLLKPNIAYADNCTVVQCIPGDYYVCANHNLFICEGGMLCFDYVTGQPCYASGGSCIAIACC